MLPDKPNTTLNPHVGPSEQRGVVSPVLVVGDLAAWLSKGRHALTDQNVVFINAYDLSVELIEEMQPAAILSPMFCNSFDCFDIAVMLQDIGFKGQFRALGPELPNPLLIRSEIKDMCPDVDFDILNLGHVKGARPS